MQNKKENLGINDVFELWINHTLQDNLTGAEFDKLTDFANNLSKEDFLPNQGVVLGMAKMWAFYDISKTNKTNISEEDKQELKSLEQKAREILIEEAKGLDFDGFKKLLECAHINQNTGKKNTNQNTGEVIDFRLSNKTNKVSNETNQAEYAGIELYKEESSKKEESSEEVEYKIGGKLLEMLRQNLTGREFSEFSECVENDDASNYDLFEKAKDILIKSLESYPILIAISRKRAFVGIPLKDMFK